MKTIAEENASAPATAASEQPKTTKKATREPRGAHVAPAKGKATKKASPAKKAPKGAKKATGARDGSKTAIVLDLLKQPGGVSAKELIAYASYCTYLAGCERFSINHASFR
jgi:hypothetical protein